MIRFVRCALFIILALCLVAPATAHAVQQATPTSAPQGPACNVTPQAVEELIALAFPQGTPAAALASPTPVATESELPQGTPADTATAAAVEQVVQTMLVCLLAGDEARLLALMTDDLDAAFIQQYVSLAIADTPAELRALLKSTLGETLHAASTQALAPVGREVRVLADGRVGGIWNVDGSDVFVILEQHGESWLADEIIEIDK